MLSLFHLTNVPLAANGCISSRLKMMAQLRDAKHALLLLGLHQLDVNNALLHGYLDEEIYMQPPEGYSVQPGHVCGLLNHFTSPSSILIADIKAYLDKLFTIKDLGLARYFLGLQIARSSAGTSLTQAKYIRIFCRILACNLPRWQPYHSLKVLSFVQLRVLSFQTLNLIGDWWVAYCIWVSLDPILLAEYSNLANSYIAVVRVIDKRSCTLFVT
ncbi:UNVERIFIED_CONTAM: hypothetical protein Sradi_1896100 [Sesamum radiatum]|uniref:Reverse transcriptase Ty1/copia-type domain-containing protein n=1 Tax=Sesamum radiatum TaxID=300843 RepID=A0AAW2TYC3_SESRA